MNAVDGAKIERRIPINRPDEENARCKDSRAWDPRKGFSQCMLQPTILSTSSAISPQQERTEPSGHWHCKRGVKSSPRREPDVPADLLRTQFGNVTKPSLSWAARESKKAPRRVAGQPSLDTTSASARSPAAEESSSNRKVTVSLTRTGAKRSGRPSKLRPKIRAKNRAAVSLSRAGTIM